MSVDWSKYPPLPGDPMKKLLFITILALLMLSGCVKTVTLVVYNNSGKDVCITALG